MLQHVPPTIARYALTGDILDTTWAFLRERGEREVEAVVLWVGVVHDEAHAEVLVAIPPPQIAYRSDDGLWVEIPQDGLSELIGALPAGVQVLARVHSHPGEAYHSDLDNTNMVIAHEGAISIVVPDFGDCAVSLGVCSVNRLRADGRWDELNPGAVSAMFEVS